MEKISFSKATRRDWENVKRAVRQTVREFREDPFGLVLLAAGSTIVGLIMWLPWLLD